MTLQEQRDRKEKQIATAKKYLKVAKELGLSEDSVTVKYWTRTLQEWKEYEPKENDDGGN